MNDVQLNPDFLQLLEFSFPSATITEVTSLDNTSTPPTVKKGNNKTWALCIFGLAVIAGVILLNYHATMNQSEQRD